MAIQTPIFLPGTPLVRGDQPSPKFAEWLASMAKATRFLQVISTLDFPNTGAQTASDLTVTVLGAQLGDFVELSVPVVSIQANSSYSAWVSAADEVTVRFNNYSSSAKNPGSGDFRVRVRRG